MAKFAWYADAVEKLKQIWKATIPDIEATSHGFPVQRESVFESMKKRALKAGTRDRKKKKRNISIGDQRPRTRRRASFAVELHESVC